MKTRGSCGIVAGKQVRYCSIWQVSYLDSYERHLCLPPNWGTNSSRHIRCALGASQIAHRQIICSMTHLGNLFE